MYIALLLLVGCALTLGVSFFLAKMPKTRALLAGKFVGVFFLLLGIGGTSLIVFRAVTLGVIATGRRSQISFAEQPVVAPLVFLITIACMMLIVNTGWKILKELSHTKIQD
jgi:hypothetical protein